MAIKHRAFTFYPGDFFRAFESAVMVDSKPSLERLYIISKEAATHPSVTMSRALTFFRYDEDWYNYDFSDPQSNWDSEWFLVFLASTFKAAPDLSSSAPFSYEILEGVLKIIGWSKESITLLIKGKSLKTLVYAANNPLLTPLFTFPQYRGGWLSEGDIAELYSKLALSEEIFFEHPNQFNTVVADISKRFYLTPDEVIRKSYIEATSMLFSAIQRKSALFLILD